MTRLFRTGLRSSAAQRKTVPGKGISRPVTARHLPHKDRLFGAQRPPKTPVRMRYPAVSAHQFAELKNMRNQ